MNSQRSLVRILGMGYVIIFVVANIVGSGVFKKIAPMAAELQSPGWIMIAWAAGGVITMLGALSNAEVAGLLANTGGDYVYLSKIYNRFFGFIFGWTFFTVIQTAAISSVAYVFTQSLNSIIKIPEVLPSLSGFSIGGIFYPFQDFGIKLVTIGLIVMLTAINIAGLKSGAGLGKALFYMIMAGLLIIVVFGLTSSSATTPAALNNAVLPARHVSVSVFFTAMLSAFWAYQGWSSVGFIGGEIKNANKNIPRGIILGTILVVIIYLLVNFTYLSLLSVSDLTRIHDSGNQIAGVEAVRTFWGNGGAMFISILILLSTLGCTNASILTGARPYFAMAQEGLFFRGISRINGKNVPGNSLLLQGIWSSVLVLSGTFDQLTDMTVFSIFIFYGATALGVIILRRKMPDAPRPYKVWGYPFIPAIYVLFCSGLIINTIITRPREAGIGLALILLGIPFYFIFRRIYPQKVPDNK